ncbi:MAG TPA: polymer-forming cytoskeletal protein [bacterium (Candidatus Stahlbacteria)]|nr:polymer-forming cytoskeletal protein [Candidatus Stahlbacteria bacterium]
MDQEGKLDSVIGRSTKIKGNINTEGGLKLDGQVVGDVVITGLFIAGKDAEVRGNVNCQEAVVGGKIIGNITAQKKIELKKGATINGDIICRGLIIEDGVFFEGSCRMGDKKSQ